MQNGRRGKEDCGRTDRKAAKPRVDAMKAKGVNKTVRCMIVGIPNVGKSTLINRIAGQSRAEVGDRPGVTRGKQWVKITPYLELMDTPGMLWPKLEDQTLAKHLAFLGSIKDEIMDSEELADDLLAHLQQVSPTKLSERYSKLTAETPRGELLTRSAGVGASCSAAANWTRSVPRMSRWTSFARVRSRGSRWNCRRPAHEPDSGKRTP